MPKTINHNMHKKRKAKEDTWVQKRKFANSWRNNEVSQTFIQELIEKMLQHFSHQENICFISFLTDLGIEFKSFTRWCKKYSELDDDYRFILNTIGARREKKAIYKRYNTHPTSITPTLRHYHPFWRKSYDEDMKKENITEPKVIIIDRLQEKS